METSSTTLIQDADSSTGNQNNSANRETYISPIMTIKKPISIIDITGIGSIDNNIIEIIPRITLFDESEIKRLSEQIIDIIFNFDNHQIKIDKGLEFIFNDEILDEYITGLSIIIKENNISNIEELSNYINEDIKEFIPQIIPNIQP